MEYEAWQERAACAGLAPEFDADPYFQNDLSRGRVTLVAVKTVQHIHRERAHYSSQLQVCAACPVRRQCAKAAVDYEYAKRPARQGVIAVSRIQGILGGHTPTERMIWYFLDLYPSSSIRGRLARRTLRIQREIERTREMNREQVLSLCRVWQILALLADYKIPKFDPLVLQDDLDTLVMLARRYRSVGMPLPSHKESQLICQWLTQEVAQ